MARVFSLIVSRRSKHLLSGIAQSSHSTNGPLSDLMRHLGLLFHLSYSHRTAEGIPVVPVRCSDITQRRYFEAFGRWRPCAGDRRHRRLETLQLMSHVFRRDVPPPRLFAIASRVPVVPGFASRVTVVVDFVPVPVWVWWTTGAVGWTNVDGVKRQ